MKEVNLFSDDVVIILGAGASVPFGLPTGSDLIDQIQSSLSDELKTIETDIRKNKPYQPIIPNSLAIEDVPLACALANNLDTAGSLDLNNSKNQVSKLADWLKEQVSDSIDDLIRHNDHKANELKKCIAYELLIRSHERATDFFKRRNFDARHVVQIDKKQEILYRKDEDGKKTSEPITIRNWIHNFINIARLQFIEKFKSIEEWRNHESKPKIKIINFNYDSIFEDVVEKSWKQVATELPNSKDVFEIVHPHGKIEIPTSLGKAKIAKWITDNFENIAVIHDIEASIANRDEARKFISDCNQLFAIGFAFAKANCDMLGIESLWANEHKSIHYLNFDDNKGLDIRVERFDGPKLYGHRNGYLVDHEKNKSHVYPMSPLKGDYLQITDALMGGFLGEMPS